RTRGHGKLNDTLWPFDRISIYVTGGKMNSSGGNGRARAVADLAAGEILASVEVAAPPQRVFQALASNELVNWWVGEGIVAFRTTEWTGDVRVGGGWRASGVVDEVTPFALEGEFLEIDSPR